MTEFNKYDRYQRQIILKELGTVGQDKLSGASVVVIGAGGLGCPALQYLAAAGVGTIGIVDFDLVELTNLHRQTLYNMEDIGKSKALQAAQKLRNVNPGICVIPHPVTLDNRNAPDILGEYDIVIDGSDNFVTRYMVNDACLLLDKPLVYGAVHRFSGQTGVFNYGERKERTNYRDLFPQPPQPSAVPSCNDTGVLGVLPGIIGTMQAAECIKIITGIGKPLRNRIMNFSVLDNTWFEFQISPHGSSEVHQPLNRAAFEQHDYAWFCNNNRSDLEISVEEFEALRKNGDLSIIDVREENELPVITEFSYRQMPLSRFDTSAAAPADQQIMVLFCVSGKRSMAAVRLLKEQYPEHDICSLQGGIDAWKKYQLKTNK